MHSENFFWFHGGAQWKLKVIFIKTQRENENRKSTLISCGREMKIENFFLLRGGG